ncbi:MAG: hypothetical protein RIM84_18350 [Alphaproteobacteria bacterium]
MPQTIGLNTRKPVEIGAPDLAAELAERFINVLAEKSWAERLDVLMELHDQLRDDIENFAMFCEVFPMFIGKLVEQLGGGVINSQEQAHVYANSAVAGHRQAAGDWFRANAA